MSLSASWKLIRRCTLATAPNAASTAARISDADAPDTAISTNVPSSGRDRRRLFEAGSNGHDPLHAFGHVVRRQGGAGNIADVAAHLQRARARLSDELREPTRASDLAAIGLAVLQDVHVPNPPARIQGHDVVDVEMLPDHAVEDEEAEQPAARFRPPDAAGLDLGETRRRKRMLLRLRQRHVLDRVSGRGRRDRHRGGHRPIDPLRHA